MTATASNTAPHNLVAEKSVLGAVLLDEQHLHALLVDEQLRPEHFYLREHAAVFQAMLELYNTDKKIDHLTVAPTLSRSSSAGFRQPATRATTDGSCASRRRCARCWTPPGRSSPT
jgi:replicative DNA helicase